MENPSLSLLDSPFENNSLFGDPDQEEFQRLTSQNPNNFAAYGLFATSLQQKNKHEQAIKIYNLALQRLDLANQHNTLINSQAIYAELYNGLGLCLHSLGRFDEAIQAYNSSIDKNPMCEQTYLHLALTLYKQGDIDGAVGTFNYITTPTFQQIPAYYNLSIILGRLDRLEEVIRICELEIRQNPNNVNAYFTLGLAFRSQGNLIKSCEAFRSAINLAPLFLNAYNNLGNVLSDMGDINTAIKVYKDALRVYPSSIDTYYNLGIVLEKQGRIEQAIRAYEKLLEICPKDSSALMKLGQLCLQQDNLQKAEDTFRAAVSLRPKSALAYVELGIVLYSQNRFDESMQVLNFALELDSNNIRSYYYIGLSYYRQKDFPNAEKMLYTVLRYHMSHIDAHLSLGLVFHDQSKMKEAIDIYYKAIILQPNCSEAYIGLGIVYYDQENITEAIRAFETAIRVDRMNVKGYNNLGLAFLKAGEVEKAIEAYTKGIEIDPEFILCYCNRGKAYNHLGREESALMDFNKAYELLQNETLNLNLSARKRTYVNSILTNERKDLLDKLAHLHQDTLMIENMMESQADVNQEDKVKFTMVKKSVMALTDKVVDNIQKRDDEVDEIAKLKNEIQVLKEMNEHMQVILRRQIQRVDKHDKTLYKAGVYAKERVKEEFKALANDDPELFKYANTFYWTLLNYFTAYRALGTKIVNSNHEDDLPAYEKIFNFAIRKVAAISSMFTNNLPIVEGAINLLDQIVDELIKMRSEMRFFKKIRAINLILTGGNDMNVTLEDDISLACATAALKIIKAKPTKLKSSVDSNNSADTSIDSFLDKPTSSLKKKTKKLNSKVLSYMNYSGSPAAEEALSDVAWLLSYLYLNYEEVMSCEEPLDVQFVEIVVQRKWENKDKSMSMLSDNSKINAPKCNVF